VSIVIMLGRHIPWRVVMYVLQTRQWQYCATKQAREQQELAELTVR